MPSVNKPMNAINIPVNHSTAIINTATTTNNNRSSTDPDLIKASFNVNNDTMKLEGLTHLSVIETTLYKPTEENGSQWIFNQTALEELNDAMFVILAPSIALLVVIMIVGVIGNLAVCYVFFFKLKVSAQNNLLLSLGVFDLLSCCIGVPSEIYDMRHYYLYQSVTACKSLRFLTIVMTAASVLVLLVIAVERFRKICYPLHKQFEPKQIRFVVVAILFASVLIALPSVFIYGHRSFPTGIPYLYGHDCSVDDGVKHGVFPLVYEVLFAAAFATAILILISVYLRIMIETRRHTKYMKKNTSVGVISHEEKTLSSDYNNSGAYDSGSNDVTGNNTQRNNPVALSLLSRVFKYHRRFKKERNCVTERDKKMDTSATEKMNAVSIRTQGEETNSNFSDAVFECHSEAVRLNDRHMVIHEDKENDNNKTTKDAIKSSVLTKSRLEFNPYNTYGNYDDGTCNNSLNETIISPTSSLSFDPSSVPLSPTSTITSSGLENLQNVAIICDNTRIKNRKSRNCNVSRRATCEDDSNNIVNIRDESVDACLSFQAPNSNTNGNNTSSSIRCESNSNYNYNSNIGIPTTCELQDSFSSKSSPSERVSYYVDSINNMQHCDSGHEVSESTTNKRYSLSSSRKGRIYQRKSVVSFKTAKSQKAINSRRATVISFVITFGFILSYLPHLILIILRSVITDFEHNLDRVSLVFYNIFLRSYFANNVINIFVYGSMNLNFRQQLKKLILERINCFRKRD